MGVVTFCLSTCNFLCYCEISDKLYFCSKDFVPNACVKTNPVTISQWYLFFRFKRQRHTTAKRTFDYW